MAKPDFERPPIDLSHFEKSRIIAINACKPLDPEETGEIPEPDLARVLPRVWQDAQSMGSDWRVSRETLRISLNKFYLNATTQVSESVARRTQAVLEEIKALNPAIQSVEDLRAYLDKLGVQTVPFERQARATTLYSSTTSSNLLRDFDPAAYSSLPQPDQNAASEPIIIADFLQNLRDAEDERKQPTGIGGYIPQPRLFPSDTAPTAGHGNPLTKRNQ